MTTHRVMFFPEHHDFVDNAKRQLLEYGKRSIVHSSDSYWEVADQDGKVVLVAGVWMPCLIGRIPELWLILCNDFRKHLRDNIDRSKAGLSFVRTLYYDLQGQVSIDAVEEIRFAEWMGWNMTALVERTPGHFYNVYRL